MGIADDMKGIADDIITSYDLRVKAIGELVSNVHKTLKGFASDRKRMSEEQAQALTDFVADLTKNVSHMIKGFQKDHKEMAGKLKTDLAKGVKEIEAYVKNRLKEFSNAHADMSEALKKDLAKYVGDIVSGVKKLLGDYGSDMKKAKEAWRSMAATLAKSRGIKPKVKVGVKVRPVKEAVKEKAKGPAGEILSTLEDYPDGATLAEIADEMGVHFASLIRPMGKLVDAGKVEKKDNRYLLA